MYNVVEISVSSTKRRIPEAGYIDNDLVLFDHVSMLPFFSSPNRMQCLLLVLCTSGHAHYSVDTREQTVESGDVIIVSEGQVLSDYLMSPDFEGIAMMLSGDFFHDVVSGVHELSQIFLFSRTHPVFRLTEREMEVLKEYFYLIRQKVDDEEHHFRKALVSTLIKSLIIDMSNTIYRIQQIDSQKQTRAEGIFTDFIRLVETHFREERRVGWYAEQLCITPKYLSESVKSVSKRRPNEWIDNYVVMEIRVLLKNTPMTIKEIAQQMHFANQSFLGKYFKEHVGMSPKKYRKA